MTIMDAVRPAVQKVRQFFSNSERRKYVLLVAGAVLPLFWLIVDFDDMVKGNKAAAKKLAAGAYTTSVIAFYWMTETLPIAVTALFPVILFPILGVTTAKTISSAYFNDTIFLMVGSFIFAVSMERWNLHRKLALKFLLLIGERPRMMMAGFMAITAFLSMWISNTATTSMMTPLVLAVLGQLSSEKKRAGSSAQLLSPSSNTDEPVALDNDPNELESITTNSGDDNAVELDLVSHPASSATVTSHEDDHKRFSKACLLGIAYSASLGGTATLVGTGTNVILVQTFSRLFPSATPISFGGWFLFATPLALILLAITFGLLTVMFTRNTSVSISRRHLEAEHDRVGPLTWEQIVLIADLLFMVLSWFLRPILTEKGWLKSGYITDGTISMVAGLVLFIIPSKQRKMPGHSEEPHATSRESMEELSYGSERLSENNQLETSSVSEGERSEHARNSNSGNRNGSANLEGDRRESTGAAENTNNSENDRSVESNHKKIFRLADNDTLLELPWDIVILLGGGLALAEGFQASGLSIVLADRLNVLSRLPLYFMITLVCFVVLFTTELTSNIATVTLVLPILAAMGQSTSQHPLLLMIPATICCSLAFMLPVATPPNAIVFSSNILRVADMAKAGLLLNILSLLLVPSYMLTFGSLIFGINFKQFPDWAKPPVTAPSPS